VLQEYRELQVTLGRLVTPEVKVLPELPELRVHKEPQVTLVIRVVELQVTLDILVLRVIKVLLELSEQLDIPDTPGLKVRLEVLVTPDIREARVPRHLQAQLGLLGRQVVAQPGLLVTPGLRVPVLQLQAQLVTLVLKVRQDTPDTLGM
jgi:hypothetical protein